MSGASSLLRSLLIYSICLPVAVILGYTIAQEGNPLFNPATYFVIGSVFCFLALPLVLRLYHVCLLISWNLGAVLFFVPGRPDVWMLVVWISLFVSIGQYILNRRLKFLSAPGVAPSLMFLLIVVILTAELRGGIGLAAFGSQVQGGKRYIFMFTAIAAYFALTSQPIPPRRATLYICLFFLGSLAQVIGDLAPLLPSGMYYVFLLFPVSTQGFRSIVNPVAEIGIWRLGGLSLATSAIAFAILARYGIRQLLTFRRVLLLLVLFVCVAIGTLGGFRSTFVFFALTFVVLFHLEGLTHTRLLPVFVLATLLAGATLVATVNRLPLNVQRTLSVLPLPVDPLARMSAESSSEWRLSIWRHLLPQIPNYLLLGKGLGFSSTELRSFVSGTPGDMDMLHIEGVELVADYHNGPLSVIVPFGIFGCLGFLWFLGASWRVLYRNYKYGHPAYHNLNRFLFGFFIAKTIFFFAVFGNLYSDLAMFVGLVGMSVSLNCGVARRMIFVPRPKLHQQPRIVPPGLRKPVGAAQA